MPMNKTPRIKVRLGLDKGNWRTCLEGSQCCVGLKEPEHLRSRVVEKTCCPQSQDRLVSTLVKRVGVKKRNFMSGSRGWVRFQSRESPVKIVLKLVRMVSRRQVPLMCCRWTRKGGDVGFIPARRWVIAENLISLPLRQVRTSLDRQLRSKAARCSEGQDVSRVKCKVSVRCAPSQVTCAIPLQNTYRMLKRVRLGKVMGLEAREMCASQVKK